MKLQQLKYLLAIVDNGLNITAAAERLYTSQPGVSKQLKLLEEELGMELFARKGKSLHCITRAGEQVIKHARAVMGEVDHIRSLAQHFYREEEGTLTIAATNTQARYVLPDILRELRHQYPRVRLNLHQGTSEQVAAMMSNSEIDFAIASGTECRFRNLLCVPSYQWDKVILVPNGHQLTKIDRELTLQDLVDFPLVSYVFSFEDELTLQKSFADQGLAANVVFTARDSEIIKTYVRTGAGIGVVAGIAYESSDRSHLTAIPANGLFQRSTTWIGIRRNTRLRCYMTDFLRLFAPHLDSNLIEGVARASDQSEVNQLVQSIALPVKNGFNSKLSAAA